MSSSHSSQSAGEPPGKEAKYREMVHEMLSLSLRERDVLNKVITWSIRLGHEWAVFSSMEDFAALCGVQRSHVFVVIAGLGEKHLLEKTSRRGALRMRFLPAGILVDPPLRTDSRKLAEILARTQRLNAAGEDFDPDGQAKLALKTPEEQVGDDQASQSRRRGVALLREERQRLGGERTFPVRSPENPGTESPVNRTNETRERTADVHSPAESPVNRTQNGERESSKPDSLRENPENHTVERTGNVRSNPISPVNRTDGSDAAYIGRVPASEHAMHAPSTLPCMPHEHALRHAGSAPEKQRGALRAGLDRSEDRVSIRTLEERLDEEARYALAELEALVGEDAAAYHRTWLLRLNDEGRGSALDAIGEVKYLKNKGEQEKKGWGYLANFLFKKYEAKARKATDQPEN
jgi:hypothetical protein